MGPGDGFRDQAAVEIADACVFQAKLHTKAVWKGSVPDVWNRVPSFDPQLKASGLTIVCLDQFSEGFRLAWSLINR